MTFGPLIEATRFEGDAAAHTRALRDYVSTRLAAGPDVLFKSEKD
eukprot:CAMPEP_0195336754 /NCGR_PEP_ID=MMETSP0708-20121125/16441_1 /TAXON_ID=33640 /ORGANISM="Asterionellopsis glacialis, Strain CCMP134" /LENGTH=44 /DNA_ID= /DNA_START= /DNA_END= /DNA_ORIENTATION=